MDSIKGGGKLYGAFSFSFYVITALTQCVVMNHSVRQLNYCKQAETLPL